MKTLAKIILFATIISMAWSWGSMFGRFKDIKEKKDNVKDSLNLDKLGLSSLKELSLKDIASMENLDLDSNLDKIKDMIPKKAEPNGHSELDAFWTGMYEFFGLERPAQVLECHGSISGNLFLRKLRKSSDLLQHSRNRDNLKVYADYVELGMIQSAMDRASNCAADTPDYKRLADLLDITNDKEEFIQASHLYYQAKYAELAAPFESVIQELDAGDFNKAGKIFAKLIKRSVTDFKNTGEDLLAYQAFSNGMAEAVDAPLPSDSLKCHDSRSAKIVIDFFTGATKAVADGTWYKAQESFSEFWDKEGEKMCERVAPEMQDCLNKSPDTKELIEKLGTEIGGEKFTELMFNYMNHNNIMFYGYMRSMGKSIDQGDWVHAGTTYSHLIQAAVKASS